MTILNTHLGWVVSRQTSDLLRLWCPRFWSGAMVVAGSALGPTWTPALLVNKAGRAAAVAAMAPSRYWIPNLLYAEQQLFEANNLEAPGHIRNSLSNVQCMGNLMESHEILMTSLLILLFVYVSMIFYGNVMKSGNRSVGVGHGRQGRSFKMFLTPGLRHAGKYWKILQDGAYGAPAKLVYKKLCHNHSVWCANSYV